MKNMKRTVCTLLGSWCLLSILQAQVRTELLLEKGWKFTREDKVEFKSEGFDDSKWQNVTVPHDWAIYGPFSPHNDRQFVAIEQDGQKEAISHAGRTGGLPFVGPGWYRLDFEVPTFEKGKKATLIFDGAMSHARVYINGQEAGYWPYGYNSFYVDATPYLKAGQQNELAVRLENYEESSRWYPGAGLYRNVHLITTNHIHIPIWGTYITTPEVSPKEAKVAIEIITSEPNSAIAVETRIVDSKGKEVARSKEFEVVENKYYQQLTISFIMNNHHGLSTAKLVGK